MGVFDGHGPYGHEVSDFVTRSLPENLISYIEQGADMLMALKQSFLRTNADLIEHCNESGAFDCALSGSTGTVVVHDTLLNNL